MLFRYCLNVILDVILEKHFGNSFRKKIERWRLSILLYGVIQRMNAYFFVFPTFHFQDWNNTKLIFSKNLIQSK